AAHPPLTSWGPARCPCARRSGTLSTPVPRPARRNFREYGIMRFSIGTKVTAGYALALAALVLIGAAAYISVNRLLQTTRWVDHTHQVIEQLEAIVTDLGLIVAGDRGYALTGSRSFLEPYQKGL